MKQNLSLLLCIPKNKISIKATTNDALGFIGRREGVSVISNTLIKR